MENGETPQYQNRTQRTPRQRQQGSRVTPLPREKGSPRPAATPGSVRRRSTYQPPTFRPHPRYPRLNAGAPPTEEARKLRAQRLEQVAPKSRARVVPLGSAPAGSSVARSFWQSLKADFTSGKIPAFLAAVGIVVLVYWLLTAPNFKIAQVEVKGSHYLDAKTVISMTGVDQQNIFLLDEGAIAAKLKKLPYLTDVQVSRSLPNQLKVEVAERVSQLDWKVGNTHYLVDKDGVVLDVTNKLPATAATFTSVNSLDTRTLKIGETVDSVAVNSAPVIMEKMQAAGFKVAALDYSPTSGLIITIQAGIKDGKTQNYKILLGTSADIDRKIAILKGILAKTDLKWSFADLRFESPAVS